MAKIKYNVKGVDSQGGPRVKPGMYKTKIKSVEVGESNGANTKGETMLTVKFEVIANADGSKSEFKGQQVTTWLLPDYEPTAFRFRQFLEAIGKVEGKKGEAGQIDTDALVGTEIQVQVKSDKDRDGDYMPRVGKVLALDADADEESGEEADDDEEGDDDEEEEDEDDEEGEEIDLSELDRPALKKLIKDEELDITVKKSMSDDDLREAIAEAMGADDDEEGDDDEEEEDEDDGLDALDRTGLKKLIKDNDLGTVKKSEEDDDLRARLREANVSVESDDEEDDDAAPDYDSWDAAKLKAELKERGIELEGRFSQAKAKKALKDDDADDTEPF